MCWIWRLQFPKSFWRFFLKVWRIVLHVQPSTGATALLTPGVVTHHPRRLFRFPALALSLLTTLAGGKPPSLLSIYLGVHVFRVVNPR